jgi:4-hydroxybenzoate polyprenyltransferase
VRLLRPHQWVKNVLVFVPLVLAHAVTDLHRLGAVLVAFVTFCFCASAVYVLNDLFDLEADRQHPTKRRRPLAAGALPIPVGLGLSLALVLASFGLSLAVLPPVFAGMLALYLVLTTAYSLYFKRVPLTDIFFLAGLYAHRIFAGSLAADVPTSHWLIAFSIFFFVSLALAKRYAELARAALERQEGLAHRGYRVEDLGLIQTLGPVSGCLAVLTFCLYINAPNVLMRYQTPNLLWVIGLVLFYWIARVWLLAGRRVLNEDPIIFAVRDPVSYLAGVTALTVMVLAACL